MSKPETNNTAAESSSAEKEHAGSTPASAAKADDSPSQDSPSTGSDASGTTAATTTDNSATTPTEGGATAEPGSDVPGGAAGANPVNTCIYVGNLDPKISEKLLRDTFAQFGTIKMVRIITDKHFARGGFQYAFIEFSDLAEATNAKNSLDQYQLFGTNIRVNWAYSPTGRRDPNLPAADGSFSPDGAATDDADGNKSSDSRPPGHVIFVGDIGPDTKEEQLRELFSPFGNILEIRIMLNPHTGKSRGYGFVAYSSHAEAQVAITKTNGLQWNGKVLRVNWALFKPDMRSRLPMPFAASLALPPSQYPLGPRPPPAYYARSPLDAYYPMGGGALFVGLTTVYVGNLAAQTTQSQLMGVFKRYGYIQNIRLEAEKGFAFIKYDVHECAANAIMSTNGYVLNGRPLRCSWGRERPTAALPAPVAAGYYPPIRMQSSLNQYLGYSYGNAAGYYAAQPNVAAAAAAAAAAYAASAQQQQQQPSQQSQHLQQQQQQQAHMSSQSSSHYGSHGAAHHAASGHGPVPSGMDVHGGTSPPAGAMAGLSIGGAGPSPPHRSMSHKGKGRGAHGGSASNSGNMVGNSGVAPSATSPGVESMHAGLAMEYPPMGGPSSYGLPQAAYDMNGYEYYAEDPSMSAMYTYNNYSYA